MATKVMEKTTFEVVTDYEDGRRDVRTFQEEWRARAFAKAVERTDASIICSYVRPVGSSREERLARFGASLN